MSKPYQSYQSIDHLFTDVADKIRAEKEMHILTLSANTVGIEAAKAIGRL